MLREGSSDGENPQYEGYALDLAKKIADLLSLDYRIVPVKDGKYGSVNRSSGQWDGMMGELIRLVSSTPTSPSNTSYH